MSLFFVCFLTGLGILLFNLIFGSISDFFSIDLDFDLGLDGHGGAHQAHGILGFLSPSTISGFLVAFGGIGYFFEERQMPMWLIWISALIAGYIAAFALVKLMTFLKRHENGAAISIDNVVGLPAVVVSPILEGGAYGAIRYSVNGNTFSAPAVSFDGQPIVAGTSVAIVSIKDHLHYVSPLESEA